MPEGTIYFFSDALPKGAVFFHSKARRPAFVIRDGDSVAIKIGKTARGVELLEHRERVRFRQRRDRHGELEAFKIGKARK
jgi:hypothetical protein